MAIYIVAYDLKKPGQGYTALIDALAGFSNSCRLQQSVWLLEARGPETALRDVLTPYLDSNDLLFVSQVSSSWASVGAPNCAQWLHARGL